MRADILREQLPEIGSALAGAFMKLASFPEVGTAETLTMVLQGAERHVSALRHELTKGVQPTCAA
jgi:hypothetical protein